AVGGFSVAKSLDADVENVGAPWAEQVFTFDYTCGVGEDLVTGSFELTPGESENVVESIGELELGTSCTVTERDAAVEGFEWTTEWDVEGDSDTAVVDGNSVTFEIGSGAQEGQPVAVGVKNIYTAETGSFDINKTITGNAAAAAANQEFTFNYSCTVADAVVHSGTTSLVGAGTVTVDDVPVMATCVVTESDAAVADTALDSSISPDEFQVTADESTNVQVDAVNEYTYVEGGLILQKFVTGNGLAHAPDEFTLNYRCVAPDYSGDVEETPIEETPIEETPIEETPIEETPIEETPNEDNSAAAQTTTADAPAVEDDAEDAAVVEAVEAVVGLMEAVAGDESGSDLGVASQEGSVTLGAGESAVIEGLIPGSMCEVWEEDASADTQSGWLGTSDRTVADWSVEYTLDGEVVDGSPVELTIGADENVSLNVENKYELTEQNGLVVIPFPVPAPGGSSGSSIPGGSSGSSIPGTTSPAQPDAPETPETETPEVETPVTDAPSAPSKDDSTVSENGGLANTGANVLWVGGIALLIMAVGALLVTRDRKSNQ
ncbi:DUF5979 domain-containing protein, partial [Corynebacterium alimapuense]